MLFLLHLEVFIKSADLDGGDVGFGVGVDGVRFEFFGFDQLIEDIKWNTDGVVVMMILTEDVFKTYVIVFFKINAVLFCHTSRAGVTAKNVALAEQVFCFFKCDHFCACDLGAVVFNILAVDFHLRQYLVFMRDSTVYTKEVIKFVNILGALSSVILRRVCDTVVEKYAIVVILVIGKFNAQNIAQSIAQARKRLVKLVKANFK